MGLRFRKSWKLGLFRYTLTNRGVSTSAGVPGARVTLGKRGTTITSSIPGSGLSYSNTLGKKRKKRLEPAERLLEHFYTDMDEKEVEGDKEIRKALASGKITAEEAEQVREMVRERKAEIVTQAEAMAAEARGVWKGRGVWKLIGLAVLVLIVYMALRVIG
jgi:hypothetical protein